MKFLFVLAALAVAAFSIPAICNSKYPWTVPVTLVGGSWSRFNSSASSHEVFCLEYPMSAPGSKYGYISLRRLNRFNDSSSSLYFCSSIYDSVLDVSCSSSKTSYSWYVSQSYSSVYGRIDYNPHGNDRGKLIYFDMKNFYGDSARDWDGYCLQGNCDSRGACINGECLCDAGHSSCDVSGLAEWIITLIVIFILILIFIPIIIIICCCCCGACCAVAAAAH